MKARILTEDLRRIVANTRLYSMKSSSVKGASLWIKGALTLRVVSSDDFIILTDTASVEGPPSVEYRLMDYDGLGAVWKALDGWSDEYYDLDDLPSRTEDGLIYSTLYEADHIVFDVDDQRHAGNYEPIQVAVDPGRLQKLGRIKPGGYLIDLRAFDVGEQEQSVVVGFKIGPTVQGVIAPVDRESLRGKLPDGSLWD